MLSGTNQDGYVTRWRRVAGHNNNTTEKEEIGGGVGTE